MSGAIIRDGHWRRRDPLKGLSLAMLTTIRAFHDGALGQTRTDVRTVRALADRGLLRRHAGPDGLSPDYAVTPEGLVIIAELRRRDTARAALIAERPARVSTS